MVPLKGYLVNCLEHFFLFILIGAYNKMSSSETETTASDMSDLSYEQEFAEVDDGPLQHCRKVST
jgi:hypothetical protein